MKLSKPFKTILIGLTSLSLLTCLTACGDKPGIAFPSDLARDCPETQVPLNTNGDMVLKVRSLRVDLKNCNADKQALREWAKDSGLTP